METEEVKNDSEVKVKIKFEERLFKCEDCEAETPWYPPPPKIYSLLPDATVWSC